KRERFAPIRQGPASALILKTATVAARRPRTPRFAPQTAWRPSGPPSPVSAGWQTAAVPPKSRWSTGCPTTRRRSWREGEVSSRVACSNVGHAHDLEVLDAARRLHLGAVAFFLADQGARDRTADVDQAELEVGLVLTNDLIFDDAGGFVFEFHRRAENDLAAGVQRGRIDDQRRRQLALDLLDTAFD